MSLKNYASSEGGLCFNGLWIESCRARLYTYLPDRQAYLASRYEVKSLEQGSSFCSAGSAT